MTFSKLKVAKKSHSSFCSFVSSKIMLFKYLVCTSIDRPQGLRGYFNLFFMAACCSVTQFSILIFHNMVGDISETDNEMNGLLTEGPLAHPESKTVGNQPRLWL
jgi:hypothetical protein